MVEELTRRDQSRSNHEVRRCCRRTLMVSNARGMQVNRMHDEDKHGGRGRPGELPARLRARCPPARPHTLDDDDLIVKRPVPRVSTSAQLAEVLIAAERDQAETFRDHRAPPCSARCASGHGERRLPHGYHFPDDANDRREFGSCASPLFDGLADPARLALLDSLREGERTAGDAAASTGLSPSNASKHLACLRECGLVESRQDWRRVYYRLADGVREILDANDAFIETVSEHIAACQRPEMRAV